MARTKSNSSKDSTANIGFEANLWLAPYKGRIYDHTCGSGGMFVQSEKFVESHDGTAMRDSAKPISEGSLREFCGAKRYRGDISSTARRATPPPPKSPRTATSSRPVAKLEAAIRANLKSLNLTP